MRTPYCFRHPQEVSHPLCQQCGERPAVIFITQMVDNNTSKGQFCEICAREKAIGEGWLAELIEQWGEEMHLSDEMREAMQDVPIDEVMMELLDSDFDSQNEEPDFEDLVFGDDSQAPMPPGTGIPTFDFETDAFDEEIDAAPHTHFASALRCPNCNTTWDRLKHDGRAGCATCYSAFRDQLLDVMARVQRGETHVGKTPRQAQKRRLRAENLRARREHQLELLQKRLKEAVAAEKYEAAAKLRDKIIEVTSGGSEETFE